MWIIRPTPRGGVNFEKIVGWSEKSGQPQHTGKNDTSTDATTKPDNGKDDGKVKIPHFAWVDGIVKGQEKLQKGWKDVKETVMFSPGAYTHQSTEKSQTAYATIGKGEIIVRDNPSQSLDSLNRDQTKTTSESQSVTNINYKAAFSYVDEVVAMQGIPYALRDMNEMWESPKDLGQSVDRRPRCLCWSEEFFQPALGHSERQEKAARTA